MSDGLAIALAVIFLVGNAFFVGAEFSLVAARRTPIEEAAAHGRPGARWTVRAMDRVSTMMAGAQLGITVCSLALGALGEPAIAHLLSPLFELVHLPEALMHPVALVISMAIVVYLHMVLGEMVPKNLAIAGPERVALLLGPPMYLICLAFRPVLWLLNAIANGVLRLLKVQPTEEVSATVSVEDVPGYLEESHERGLLEDTEHQLMAGALTMNSGRVGQVTIPVEQIIALDDTDTVAEAEETCVRFGHSRFPVRGPEGWVGYVHLKDLLDPTLDPDRTLPPSAIRELVRVPSDATLLEALRPMQRSGAHLAMVTDPATGEMAGWVMLEDVMETMIGTVSEDAEQQRNIT